MSCGCSSGGTAGAIAPTPTVDTPVTLLARTEEAVKTVNLASVGDGQGQRFLQTRAEEFKSATPTIGPVEAESAFSTAAVALCCGLQRFVGLALLFAGVYLLYKIFSRRRTHVAADTGLS